MSGIPGLRRLSRKEQCCAMTIRCVVERITYQNPENGYSVLRVHVKGYDDLVTVVGNLLDANVGSVLLVEGNWKVDSRYGKQFMALNQYFFNPLFSIISNSFL